MPAITFATVARARALAAAASLALVTPALAAAEPAPPLVTAVASESVVDSIGFNTHFEQYASPYGTAWPQVDAALHDLGVRHIRASVALGKTVAIQRWQAVEKQGIGVDFTTQTSLTAAQIVQWNASLGGVEAFELPNEYDRSHDPVWPETLHAFAATLYGAAHPLTTVFGPALTTGQAYALAGDMTAFEDYGNAHIYFNEHSPGNAGYGSAGYGSRYGSVAYTVNPILQNNPGKRIVVTEAGYGTDPTLRGNITEDQQATFLPRLFLDNFQSGFFRTYCYQLLDQGSRNFGHYGILRADLSRKPSFTAVARLLSEMKDEGSSFSPKPLALALEGGTKSVRSLLAGKHDGSYVLATWIEADTLEPQSQNLTLVTAAGSVPLTVTGDVSYTRLSATGAILK